MVVLSRLTSPRTWRSETTQKPSEAPPGSPTGLRCFPAQRWVPGTHAEWSTAGSTGTSPDPTSHPEPVRTTRRRGRESSQTSSVSLLTERRTNSQATCQIPPFSPASADVECGGECRCNEIRKIACRRRAAQDCGGAGVARRIGAAREFEYCRRRHPVRCPRPCAKPARR